MKISSDKLVTSRGPLVIGLISLILGVGYNLYGQCGKSSFLSTVALSIFAGAAGAVLFYKIFNETETSLNRRLNRIKSTKLVSPTEPNRPVRIWVDGCFDMMHFGHSNAFRQAKALGDVLVVGVNTDEDIRKHKGPPIMNDAERTIAVAACKWVDEVVPGAPYVMTDEYLQYIFEKYQIDYVVHGDDPCLLADGTDVFASAKKAGRFKTVKRTEGVSTTDIVGRMLLMTTEHHDKRNRSDSFDEATSVRQMDITDASHAAFVRGSTFMPTGRRFIQFSNNKAPKPTDKVVYVDGTWDMFHAGHIEFLQKCKEQGDYLIVGVYPDDVANHIHGSNYPIMNLHERVLSVLSCKYVDDVVFGAPWKITRDLIVTFNIQTVCHGVVSDSPNAIPKGYEDPYALVKELNMLVEIQSPRDLKTQDIVDRIIQQKVDFEKKFKKKAASEEKYNQEKEYVEEL